MNDSIGLPYLRTLIFAAVLGVPVALAAVLFQTAVHDVIHLVWDEVPQALDWDEPAWWYVLLVPALAGILVAGALRLPGHGGHSPLEGLGAHPIAPGDLTSILPAAVATLGLGLVLGPEAPLIALGLGIGALAVRATRLEPTEGRLLVSAGAFAAIAALFGGPLIAALLLFEVTAAGGQIPAKQIGRALLPGFVAAGTGALVFTGVADWPGLHQASLALPTLPPYDTVRIADLAWCLLLAAVVAAVVVAIRRLAYAVAAQATRGRTRLLVGSGLGVGAVAVAFRVAADRPVDLVLFSGQSDLPTIVAEGSAQVLALVVLAKGLAYALSLGAGFRGGPVFPAIAIGVAASLVGAALIPGLSTTPAVATGIAAGTAAVLRVPFTAVLLVSLLVGPSALGIAPIAVLAAATGWLVASALADPAAREGRSPAEPAA